MSSYIINFKNTSDEEGTVIADAGFNYTDNLSSMNKATIKISGTSETKRSLIEIGSEVKIYRNGTLEFHGLVDMIDFLEGGGLSVTASGYEVWLAKENGDYANSPYSSTASATIFGHILGESSKFTAGTVNAGTDIDFRIALTDSLWNAIANLKDKTGQDIGIDYANSEIDILDHKGSSTTVATFNAGIHIANIRVSQNYPIGNDVRVYGMSEGETRIKSDHASYGQDPGSKTTYGTIRKIVRDPSILTVAEANKLADALVAIYKLPVKIYDFEVLNPSQSIVAGDVITLNSKSQGLSNEEVRVVGIEKGFKSDQEYLVLQVTNKEYSKLIKDRNEILASIEKNARDAQTYDQFASEYANQNCATCVGGCSCFDGTTSYLGGMMTIGTGAGGCSGNWAVFTGNISVAGGTPGILQGNYLNIGWTGCANCIAEELGVACNVVANTAPSLGCHLTNKTYVDACAGGAAGLFIDGDAPYIYPCNSCGVCMTGDIVSANSTNCMGCAASPGAWKEIHALCIEGATHVCAPTVYGSTLICGGDVCAVDDVIAGDDICATSFVCGAGLNIGASSACTFYVTGNGIYSGTLNMTYLDGTCICGSRKVRIPVGTNCY